MIYDKFQAETEIKDSRRPLPPTQNPETAESLEPDTKSRQCPKTGRVLAEFSVRSSPFLRSDLVPIRSHSCPECRKNFATSSGLKQHQHIHKSVKPFQCKVCLKAYTQFSNLCRHKRMHADCRQQIKCLGCGQAFSTLISLNKHKRFCDADHGGIIRRIRQTSDQFGHPPNPPIPVYRSHLSSIAVDRDPVPYPLPLTLPQPAIGAWNMYRPQLPHQISSHLWFPGPSSPSSSSASAATMPIFQRSSLGLMNAYETFQRLMDPRLFSPTYNRPQNLNEDANGPGYDVRSPEINGMLSPDRVCREMHQETINTSENTGGKRDRVNSERYESPDRSASNTSTSPRSSRSGFRAWRETSPAPGSRDRELILRLETKESSFLRSSPCPTIAKIINREEPRPLDLTTSHKSFARFDPGDKKRTEDILTTPTSFPSVESLATSADLRVSTKPVLYLGLSGVGRLEDPHGSSNRDLYLGRPRIDRYGDVPPMASTSRAALFDEGGFLDPSYPQLLSDNHCRFDHDHLPFTGQRNETGHISISKHPNIYHGNHGISSFSSALVSPLASISDLLSFKPAKPRDRYTCRYCGKVFPRSANLTRHLRTHTGEQPYKCQYCRRCFSISSNLQRHVRNIHNKEKPFRCPLCERCFGQQTNLDRHIKKHESSESICSVSTDCPTGIFNHPHQLDSAFPRRDQFFQDHNGFLRNPSLPQTTPRETDSRQVPGTGRSAKVDSGVESTDGNSSPTRWRETDEWGTVRKSADGGRTSVDSESESIDVVDTSSESNVDNDAIGNDDISTCIYGSDHDEASDDEDVIIDVTDCPVTP